MNSYEVKLDLFEGPLDLLLYLIKKQDMDIQEIQISQITHEYLETLSLMKELSLGVAGEFLVMASTLMQIKAQSLLPPSSPDSPEEGPDPRAELVSKLLEYQKFKEAAKFLSVREFESREIYYRNTVPSFSEEDLHLEATLFDLLSAFKTVLNQAQAEIKELLYEEIPLEQKIREILDLLENTDCLQFLEIFSSSKTRRELIMTFLALLELIRLKQVVAKQSESLGEIRIYRLKEEKSTVPSGNAEEMIEPQEESHGQE
ncbi:MAG: segregation/condensation protein A [Elusimicrobia bacterium]|nr:segregation/condensation protein A [Elusimicrobiota bacterium]MBI2915359.1 segregation/condensation protein A [Elusimicrobiota bacterium]MBI3012189.1 segregation/condensation protein A [Elusimicrobiota bacterium]